MPGSGTRSSSLLPGRDSRDQTQLTQTLSALPAEIRLRIYAFIFNESKVYVTAQSDCVCSLWNPTETQHSEAHQWLLDLRSRRIQREALDVFFRRTQWEFHCPAAYHGFLERLSSPRLRDWNYLDSIRHVAMGIPRLSRPWRPMFERLSNLETVVFSDLERPMLWFSIQETDSSWLFNIPPPMEPVTDEGVLSRLRLRMGNCEHTRPLLGLLSEARKYTIEVVCCVTHHVQPDMILVTTWSINLDTEIVDRNCEGRHPFPLSKEFKMKHGIYPLSMPREY